MKVVGFDRKVYSWNLKSSELQDESRSKLHIKARELLDEIFPYAKSYEDVTLPGSSTPRRRSSLYADFFIPTQRLIVEVHGEQHTKHINYFHKTKHIFLKACLRDKEKIEWCEMNGFAFVALGFDQTIEEWRKAINDR